MTLEAALLYTAGLAETITGIKAAPDYPPESVSAYPFVLTYPSGGNLEWEPGLIFKGLHQITCELHFDRAVLPKAIKTMIPFIKSFADKIKADPTLGGTVDTIVASANTKIEYAILFQQFAKVPEVVIQFKFTCKIRE